MTSKTRLTVRYAETDQMGIVHHSHYPVWFEAGRTDFLKKAGMSYTAVEAGGILLPLYEINCRYLSPAKYEDELTVVTRIKKLSRVRLILSYEVVRETDGALLAAGETMHAFTDASLRPLNAEKACPGLYALLRQALESADTPEA
jgi:acyl-CoA thioester hydrolase